MRQTTKKAHSVFIGTVFIIIIVVLGFTSVLNVLSFRQNYEDSLINSYVLAGNEAVGKIEYALKYGKPLNNFYGMQDLLAQVKAYLPETNNVFVVLPNGELAYDLHGRIKDKALGEEMLEKIHSDTDQEHKTYSFLSEEKKEYIFIPIVINEVDKAGSLGIVFDEQVINHRVNTYLYKLITYLIILSIVSLAVTIVLYKRLLNPEHTAKKNRGILLKIILISLAVVQLVFGSINYSIFKTGYLDITKETASMASNIVKQNVETVVSQGVPYSRLYNIEEYLMKVVDAIPQIGNISIVNAKGVTLYSAIIHDNDVQPLESEDYSLSLPLGEDSQEAGYINVELSKAVINSSLKEILLNTITILIVSLFYMIEITLMVITFMGKRLGVIEKSEGDNDLSAELVRPLAFFVYGSVFMTAAFVPVIMSLIYKPIFGLSKEIELGLPISVEMLCGLIATLAAGFVIDKKGWKRSFVSGVALFIIGSILSGFVKSPIAFILARGITGAGFGLLVMAMRTLVISSGKSTGIADMNAGATAGVTCGVVTGAMVADRIGFDNVFYISAALALLALLFAVIGITNSGAKVSTPVQRVSQGSGSFAIFIRDKQVLSFLILILIPFSISAMFLNFYFPLYANDMGMSSSNVGRAFMLNALCVIYLGPFLSKYFLKKHGSMKPLIISVILTAAAMLIFAILGSMTAALAALLLMGVSDSFGISAQIDVYMKSNGAKILGEGKAIAYYSLVSKLGQMLGPMIFGMVALLGITKGIGLVSVSVLFALGLYLLIAKNKPTFKKTTSEDVKL